MIGLFLRACLVWFAILLVAIVNGAFRQGVLIPRLGDAAAHVGSTVLLSIAVIAVTFFTIRWISPTSVSDCWSMGILWVVMTMAFEFLGGHYLFGKPWVELFADYKINQGRIWVLVLFVTFMAPVTAARLRGLFLGSILAQ